MQPLEYARDSWRLVVPVVVQPRFASIEDLLVIEKILAHLEEKAPTRAALLFPDSRAPPQSSLFG
jgi:hypothetical protein